MTEQNLSLDGLKQFKYESNHDYNKRIMNLHKKMSEDSLREFVLFLYSKAQYSKLSRYLTVELLRRNYPIITDFRTNAIRAYTMEANYYEVFGEAKIKQFLTQIVGQHNTSHTAKEILHLLRTKTYITDEQMEKAHPLTLIPLRNGIFDLNTRKLIAHESKYLFDYQIPVDFDANAECSKLNKFFKEIVTEEDLPLLYDIAGCILYPKNIIEKFYVLEGRGSNGKSQFVSVLQKFSGTENYSAISLKQMTDDKFSVAQTYRKLLNIGADIGSQVIYDSSILKSASGSDPISGQFKFGQIFDFIPSATLAFAANEPPILKDESDGMFRRIETIHFPNKFGNEKDMQEDPNCKKAIPHIVDKITTDKELSGLLNHALKHLRDILDSGQLSVVRSVSELKKEYIRLSNPVHSFVEEMCEECVYTPPDSYGKKEKIDAQGFITVGELFSKYKEYCKEYKLNAKSREGMSKQLKKLSSWNLELTKDTFDGSQQRSVRGIRWKS